MTALSSFLRLASGTREWRSEEQTRISNAISWSSETTTTPIESSATTESGDLQSPLGVHNILLARLRSSRTALTSFQDLFCGVGKLHDSKYPVSVLCTSEPCSDRRHSVIVNGNGREPHTPYSWLQDPRSMGSIVICHLQCPPCHSFEMARYPLQFSQENTPYFTD